VAAFERIINNVVWVNCHEIVVSIQCVVVILIYSLIMRVMYDVCVVDSINKV
jgi:hypothetical protein